ncbi:MAG: DbpA RNA binding domain-containing protein [Gemmatimonadales bacterium]
MSDPNARSTVARGHNLVVFAPPSPAGTAFVLEGILDRLATTAAERRAPIAEPRSAERRAPSAEQRVWLALTPPEAVSEWARVAEQYRAGRSTQVAGSLAPARLTRLLRAGEVDLLITSPETVMAVVRRAALKLDRITGIAVIWPEAWGEEADELLAALFQDVPRENQRLIVTSDPQRAAPVIERYGWRAPVSDHLGQAGAAPTPVRTVAAAWQRRAAALADLIEALDPPSVAIWTASDIDHAGIRATIAAGGIDAFITSEVPAAASLVIAYDLPAPSRLSELATAGDVILLVPPGTESYVQRLTPERRPVVVRGALELAREADQRARHRIAEVVERGLEPGSLFRLAPLFERYEATAVAAALFELWEKSGTERTAAPPVAETRTRLWASIGRRDGVTPHDLVATLTRECEVPKTAIGRIEIRESFSLVEIAESANPEQVAERLTGKVIRKRRVVARVDRKQVRGAVRGER